MLLATHQTTREFAELPGGDGWSAEELFGSQRHTCQAYTYDDIIIMPGYAGSQGGEVSLESNITRQIKIKIPLLSSPMDTVTESEMAIGMALQGAIGVIHYNMTVEEQAREVRAVKKYKNGFITDPACLSPSNTIADLLAMKEKHGYSGFPITLDGRLGSKLVGIVTNRDIDYVVDKESPLEAVMTTKLVTGTLLSPYLYLSPTPRPRPSLGCPPSLPPLSHPLPHPKQPPKESPSLRPMRFYAARRWASCPWSTRQGRSSLLFPAQT